MIDETMARQSKVHMRHASSSSRRPLDVAMQARMSNIQRDLLRAGYPTLKHDTLRQVAARNMQLRRK